MTNPAKKLFNLLKNSSDDKKDKIEFYTKQKTSDVLKSGGQVSEVVKRCLDEEDELDFEDVFKNDLP
jgi:hypothetical protein